MDKGKTQQILNLVTFQCPLCRFKNRYRLRYTLRHHLSKEHTEEEADKYFIKALKNI